MLVQDEFINSENTVKIAKLPVLKTVKIKPRDNLIASVTKEKPLLQRKPSGIRLQAITPKQPASSSPVIQKLKLKKLPVEPQRVIPAKLVSFSPTKPEPKEEVIETCKEESKITSLYGLDVDLLRDLNLTDFVEQH